MMNEKNDIMNKNLDMLKIKYPYIYNRANEYTGICSDAIELTTTKSGFPNIRMTFEEKKIYIHSHYDPFKEGDSLLESINKEGDTIVILGLGLGYHIEHILNSFPQQNKIIIEPNIDIFMYCIKTIDITPILNAKNTLLIQIDESNIIKDAIIDFFKTSHIYSLSFIQLTSYKTMYQDMWQYVQSEFVKFFTGHVVNVKTVSVFKNLWFYNYFKNITKLPQCSNLNSFEGQFNSIPAILVASGPSLEKNIEYLKNMENNALIMAAGSAIDPLLNRGIIPHMMLGVDGAQAMGDVYSHIERKDILLTFVVNLHHDAVEKYKGPKLYVRATTEKYVEFFEKEMGYSTTVLSSGGSCSNIALDTLYQMGCDPIILIGQDLAYTNMRTHVEGAYGSKDLKSEENHREKSDCIKMEDMNGQEIFTNHVFLTMKYFFDAYFAEKKGTRTFINCSAGGLKIENAVHMGIEEAIKRYCTKTMSLRDKIKQLHEKSVENISINDEKIDEFITKIHNFATNAKTLSDRRMKICSTLLDEMKKNICKDYKRKRELINKITTKLENNDFFIYFIWPSCQDVLMALKNASETRAINEKDSRKKLIMLYDGLMLQFRTIEEKIVLILAVIKSLEVSG